jgi:predicted MPP superfamily phosphohydrolase
MLTSNQSHSRRAFIRNGALLMAAASCANSREVLAEAVSADVGTAKKPLVRVGLVTDVHYADKDTAGNRYYRESLDKMRECVDRFNKNRVDLAVELGDYIDAAETVEEESEYLAKLDSEFKRFEGQRHYVLGNHCVWTLTKQQFLDRCGASESHYSFDRNGIHFAILDACFRSDGVAYGNRNYEWTDTEIPPSERDWLKGDLAATNNPTVAFVHQRLDVAGHYGVKSAPEVRKILEASEKVLAVFHGHNHVNDHNEVNGIHYCTLEAAIDGSGAENNAYGLLDVFEGGLLRVEGFREQSDHSLPRRG